MLDVFFFCSDLPISQSPKRKFATTKILQRKPSLTINRTDTGDDDTFEHILQVTSHHETIMAYYYLDENNKVKVTEIFDVTESDSPLVQTTHEKEFNRNLEFDDDWDESTWTTAHALDDRTSIPQYELEHSNSLLSDTYLEERRRSLAEMSEYSLEDLVDRDTSNLFSDPESEWNGTYKIEEPEDDDDDLLPAADLRPESDQPEQLSAYMRTCPVPSFTYQEDL